MKTLEGLAMISLTTFAIVTVTSVAFVTGIMANEMFSKPDTNSKKSYYQF